MDRFQKTLKPKETNLYARSSEQVKAKKPEQLSVGQSFSHTPSMYRVLPRQQFTASKTASNQRCLLDLLLKFFITFSFFLGCYQPFVTINQLTTTPLSGDNCSRGILSHQHTDPDQGLKTGSVEPNLKASRAAHNANTQSGGDIFGLVGHVMSC